MLSPKIAWGPYMHISMQSHFCFVDRLRQLWNIYEFEYRCATAKRMLSLNCCCCFRSNEWVFGKLLRKNILEVEETCVQGERNLSLSVRLLATRIFLGNKYSDWHQISWKGENCERSRQWFRFLLRLSKFSLAFHYEFKRIWIFFSKKEKRTHIYHLHEFTAFGYSLFV